MKWYTWNTIWNEQYYLEWTFHELYCCLWWIVIIHEWLHFQTESMQLNCLQNSKAMRGPGFSSIRNTNRSPKKLYRHCWLPILELPFFSVGSKYYIHSAQLLSLSSLSCLQLHSNSKLLVIMITIPHRNLMLNLFSASDCRPVFMCQSESMTQEYIHQHFYTRRFKDYVSTCKILCKNSSISKWCSITKSQYRMTYIWEVLERLVEKNFISSFHQTSYIVLNMLWNHT